MIRGSLYCTFGERLNMPSFKPLFFFVFIFLIAVWAKGQPKLVLPVGHTATLTSVKFSPDGKKILTASFDNTAKLWDAATGKLLLDLKGHTSAVSSATFSPDGKKIITTSWDSTFRVWDAVTGQVIFGFKGHNNTINSGQFSPDGKTILTASSDHTAKLWDATTGRQLFILWEPYYQVINASFSPDGKTVLVCSDSTYALWSVLTGQQLVKLKGNSWAKIPAQFSADGKKILTTTIYGKAMIWDAVTGQLLLALKGHNKAICSALFSADGKKIVTASNDSTAKVWDAVSGQLQYDLPGHKGYMHFAQFTPDGKRVVTVSDNAVRIWDATSGQWLADSREMPGFARSFHISPNSREAVTADYDGKVWDVLTGKLLFNLRGHANNIASASLSSDETKLLVTSGAHMPRVWNIKTGQLLFELKDKNVTSARLSSDGKMILTWQGLFASLKKKDNTIVNLWSADNGSFLFSLKGHTEAVTAAEFSADAKKILTVSYDYTAKIWEAATGKLLVDFKNDSINDAVFSQDANKIATINRDNSCKMWDASTGQPLITMQLPPGRINSILFSPDGNKIKVNYFNGAAQTWNANTGKIEIDVKKQAGNVNFARYSNSGKKIVTIVGSTVRIWDAGTNQLLVDLYEYARDVSAVALSADEKKIITGSLHNTATIWDAVTGEAIFELRGHTSIINYVAFSPDAQTAITISNDFLVKVWDVTTGKLKYDIPEDNVSAARFDADGKKIVTASWNSTAKVWDAATGKLLLELKGHKHPVMDVQFSPDGKKIVTGSLDKMVMMWDAANGKLLFQLNNGNNFVNTVQFSNDGKKIITTAGYNPVRVWNAATGELLFELKGFAGSISTAVFSRDGKKILTSCADYTAKVWDGTSGKLLFDLTGHAININTAEFSADGKTIVASADDNSSALWDATTGKYLLDLKKQDRYNPAANQKQRVTIEDDNAIRISNPATGELLYTLVVIDSADYLVTDKYNHYDGTEAARKLLYYTCGNEIIDLEQFKDLCWEPGLAGKIMGVNNEPIKAKSLSEIDICGRTPLIESKGEYNGTYNFIITPQKGGIGEITLFVSGKQVKTYALPQLKKQGNSYLLQVQKNDIREYLLAGSDNNVTVNAYTADGILKGRGASKDIAGDNNKLVVPNLFMVSVGINDYKGQQLKLNYASKDAKDFSKAMMAASKKLFNFDGKERVNVYLHNSETGDMHNAYKKDIKKTFELIARQATADDILVIFLAGHGILKNDRQFYYLAADATATDINGVEKDVAISMEELNNWMSNIKAHKQLLILDACNSGGAVADVKQLLVKRAIPADQQRVLERLKDRTGTFILTAAASNQAAYETSLYNQGLLTYSLLYSIKTGTALRDNKFVDVTRWFNAVADQVKEMAKTIGGRQEPQLLGQASFDIGIADKSVIDAIDLPLEKKIFRRSNFQNDKLIIDNLSFGSMVDAELNEIAAHGKESKLAFMPNNTMSDSYSINGKYVVAGDKILVKAIVFKGSGDTEPYIIEVQGAPAKLQELAAKVVAAANEWIAQTKN